MSTLNLLKFEAKRQIDLEAGAARLRYITDVPGQQAVYVTKRDQAAAYIAAVAADPEADPLPTPGAYIAAESSALNITPLQLAQEVMALSALWEGTLSPAIEALRISGKAAVSAAQDEAGVIAARDAAIQALAQG